MIYHLKDYCEIKDLVKFITVIQTEIRERLNGQKGYFLGINVHTFLRNPPYLPKFQIQEINQAKRRMLR